jgi:uncharacterized membrane protein
MESKARVLDHPIHPILVTLPIALFFMSIVSDIIYFASGNSMWASIAFWNMIGGIIGALAAAIPGFIDYFGLDMDRDTSRTATVHMVMNLTLVVLFVINAIIRWNESGITATGRVMTVHAFPFILSIIGNGLLWVSGYLGGSLVYFHHLGVRLGLTVER